MNNKFLSIAASTAIVASALVFSGCGSDSSSTTTTTTATSATNSNGTLVLGLWSDVPYSTNATTPFTGSTLSGGVYKFNNNDTVTFNLSLAQLKLANVANQSVVNAQDLNTAGLSILMPNGTAYTAAQAATVLPNLVNTVLLFANTTTSEAATGYNASAMMGYLNELQRTGLVNLTETNPATFVTGLSAALNATTTAKTKNITDVATAQGQVSGLINASKALFGTKIASNYASANSLNATRLNNTMLTFANGIVVNLTTGPGAIQGANSTYFSANTTFPTWNASGSIIKLGSANTSNLTENYIVFKSALAAGASATLVYNNGTKADTTLSSIKANLYKFNALANGTLAGGSSAQASMFNITLKDAYGTGIFNASVSANGTNATNAIVWANGTTDTVRSDIAAGGNVYNLSTDNTTLTIYTENSAAAGSGNYTNITFDRDPSQNAASGIVATFKDRAARWVSAVVSFFAGLFY